MTINVQYSAQLRIKTGRTEETFKLPDGANTRDLVGKILGQYGDDVRPILAGGANEVPLALGFVDGAQIDWKNPPALRDGGEVVLMSPISGG